MTSFPRSHGRPSARILALAAVVAAVPSVQAVDYTFTSTSATAGFWSLSSRWLNDLGPATGGSFTDRVFIGPSNSTAHFQPIMNFADGQRIRDLGFVSSGGVAMTGNRLSLAAKGFIGTNPGTHSIANAITLNGVASDFATFDIDGTLTVSGALSGASSLRKVSSGVLVLSGNNTYTGTTFIDAGTLRLASAGALLSTARVAMTSGTLDLAGVSRTLAGLEATGGTVSLGSATLTVNQISSNAYYSGYAGAITGTGSLIKNGAALLSLGGTNAYTGTTTVNAGTLSLDSAGALSTASAVVVNGGALNLNGIDRTVAGLSGLGGTVSLGSAALTVDQASSSDYAGAITGTGSLTKNGAGTLTLSGTNDYEGGTSVNQGRLIDQNPHGNYATYATLEFPAAADRTYAGTVVGAGSLLKSGAGTLTVTGSVASGVTTTIAGGTLKGSGAAFKGNVAANLDSTFHLDQTKAAVYEGRFSGAGRLLKTGSRALTLMNAPGNTGGVQVSGGTLVIDGAGEFGGGLTVDAGAVGANTSGGTLNIAGRSVNQGEFDTVTGSTTVFNGLVSGAGFFGGGGTVRFNGGFSPGNSPASVTLQGDLALGSSNVLTMELGGTALGTGYDHLNVLGNASLGGALNVAYYGGFVASAGQSFDLFDFAHETGTFSSVGLPTLANGLQWDTTALYTTGTIRVQSVPEPAALAAFGVGALGLLRRRKA